MFKPNNFITYGHTESHSNATGTSLDVLKDRITAINNTLSTEQGKINTLNNDKATQQQKYNDAVALLGRIWGSGSNWSMYDTDGTKYSSTDAQGSNWIYKKYQAAQQDVTNATTAINTINGQIATLQTDMALQNKNLAAATTEYNAALQVAGQNDPAAIAARTNADLTASKQKTHKVIVYTGVAVAAAAVLFLVGQHLFSGKKKPAVA